MPYARLIKARKKIVGSKQTMRAIDKGLAKLVFVARDADRWVVEPIINACLEKGIEIIEVDRMRDLGKACSLEVNCASAAVTEY